VLHVTLESWLRAVRSERPPCRARSGDVR
jgi:hypothetical protein